MSLFDATDSGNSGLKQGLASIASYAVPALAAGLFGGAGMAGAIGAGMEGAGGFAREQQAAQERTNQAIDAMIKQRQLQEYRQQRLDIENERTKYYEKGIDSTDKYRQQQNTLGQQRLGIERTNAQGLEGVRNATIQHLQGLTSETALRTAQLNNEIMRAGGVRAWLAKPVSKGGKGLDPAAVAGMDDKTVQTIAQKYGEDYAQNNPALRDHNIAWARAAGVPAATVEAMKSWPVKDTTMFSRAVSQAAAGDRSKAITGIYTWSAGAKGSTGTGGGAPGGSGDPAIDKALASMGAGPGKGGIPLDKRIDLARQMIRAIDTRAGVDPTADLAGLDAMNPNPTKASPSTPPGTAPVAAPTTEAPAAAPPVKTVAKPAAATPATATTKPAAPAKPAPSPAATFAASMKAAKPGEVITAPDGNKFKLMPNGKFRQIT